MVLCSSGTLTRVFNVEDLEAPYLSHVYESDEMACDHNQYATADNLVGHTGFIIITQ